MQYRNFCVILIAVVSVSCASQINGVLRKDGSAILTVEKMVLQSSMTALAGSAYKDSLLDAKSLEKSIAAAPGVESASLKNLTPSSLTGAITLSQVNNFLAAPGIGTQNFIVYEQTGAGGKLSISLDRASAPRLVSLLSPELESYLSILMAPAVSENNQYITSKTAYLEELKTFYRMFFSGKTKKEERDVLIKSFIEDLQTASIRLSIDFPQNITSIQGGVFSGSRAEFDIPVLDLLVIENPLKYEVTW